MLHTLIGGFAGLPRFRAFLEAVPARGGRAGVSGLPGSSGALLVAALTQALEQRLFLVVAPTPGVAERWLSDFEALLGESARLYPQREALGEEEPHFEIAGERVETIELQQNQPGWVGEERVVVFNFRERPYTDAAGAERTGLTAIISHVATADEQIAGAGARVTLAGTLYQVATIEQAESGAGRVVLEPVP